VSKSAIGIIVLAAGESSRMGEPKQLLRVAGETLLARAVRAALETPCRPVVVVLGARADAMRDAVGATEVRVVVNPAWAEGMSSSIRCGLRSLAAIDEVEAVILLLCDQPFVTSEVIGRLVAAYHAPQTLLVAAEYEAAGERTRGVPALFTRRLFPELLALRGAEGARRLIRRHIDEATLVAVPEAAFDIDTPANYLAISQAVLQKQPFGYLRKSRS
jgi:molybdenum cofactor cytidylyltransferase